MTSIRLYLRFLLKNKLYTTVTVVGFAISLTFVLLLATYIEKELSVDGFHENKDRIYRIEHAETSFSAPIADDLKNSIPDIEDFTRVYNQVGIISTFSKKIKFEFLGVDDSFFNIFSFQLFEGDPNNVLVDRSSIVLSKSLALDLFGNESVVGKEIYINENTKLIVSGVMEDFPENTHFKPADALVNLVAMEDLFGLNGLLQNYDFCSMSIYFLEKDNANLQSKAPQILETFKNNFWMYKEGFANSVEFEPLTELYFSKKEGSGTKSNSKTLIVILAVIVLLILLLAIGNYIILTIAQSTFRGKEVAIKKLLGSSKSKLYLQFISESIFLCTISVLLAVILAKILEPSFNAMFDTRLNFISKVNLIGFLILMGIFSLIGVVSGILPAIKLSSFKPIEAIKGSLRKKSKGIYRKIFITFQYSATIILLSCTWVILRQTNFLMDKDLGFEKDNIVWVEYLGEVNTKTVIKEALLKVPGVETVSVVWGSPIDGGSNLSFTYDDGNPISIQEIAVDSSFFSLFRIDISETQVPYSKEGVYLNSAALKALGFSSPPTSVRVQENVLPLLGIVEDFNFNELRNSISPLLIKQIDTNSYASKIFIKLNSTSNSQTVEKIESTYSKMVNNAPFDLRFVDNTIEQWYVKERRTGKIIGYFTILSLVISVMGIIGMSTFYIQQRYKEIGIRKVNGASIPQILFLVSKDFLKWVGLAFIIAVPISRYVMGNWLEGFAYRTDMTWWIFALAGITSLVIASLAIVWQSFKAARLNPATSLQEE